MIIKGLDNQVQVSKNVCLIIKWLDTQAQKLNNQINQYPLQNLIHTRAAEWSSQHVESKDSVTESESDAEDQSDVSKMTWR